MNIYIVAFFIAILDTILMYKYLSQNLKNKTVVILFFLISFYCTLIIIEFIIKIWFKHY